MDSGGSGRSGDDGGETLPLSALQHYLYCPCQCALIHVERQWAENRYTAEGRILHERADSPRAERRAGVRSVAALPLAAVGLGIAGVADVVEFHALADGSERACPVEYKRGRAKAHRADEVQLCAQALCLETMLGSPVPQGALFYGKTRRRKTVLFDETLRRITLDTIRAVRVLIESGCTPPAEYDTRRCDACSLLELCQPRLPQRRGGVEGWLRRQIGTDADGDV